MLAKLFIGKNIFFKKNLGDLGELDTMAIGKEAGHRRAELHELHGFVVTMRSTSKKQGDKNHTYHRLFSFQLVGIIVVLAHEKKNLQNLFSDALWGSDYTTID